MGEIRLIMYLTFLIMILKFNQPFGVIYGFSFFVLSHVAKAWLDRMRDRD